MASKKRGFRALVPVAITVRFVLRLPLIAQLELQQLMLALMVRYAQMCAVEVLWYDFRPNHLHITAWQAFSGSDHMRRVGLSPWIRNVLSVWVRKANSYHSTQGRLTERTFRSHNITNNERLLANHAYTLGNKPNHIGESPEENPSGAWNVYAKAEPDGVVNAVPDYLDRLGEGPTDQLLLAIIWRAIRLKAAGHKRAWLDATREIIAERAPAFPAIDLPAMYDIVTTVDAEKHRAKVAEHLACQWTRIEFHPRKAPRIGDLIEIVVCKQIDPDLAFG